MSYHVICPRFRRPQY